MSAEDRWATKAFVERTKNLHTFFNERKRGLYDKDFADWCDEIGLSNRTARENYWDRAETRGIIRIIFEKNQKFWEYCESSDVGNVGNIDSETDLPFMDYVERLKEVNEVRRKMGFRPLKGLKKHG